MLAWRYLRGERSQVLSSTALAALVATTLGVTSMVIALALMTGYTGDLKQRLIGFQGEILASPLGRDVFEDSAESLAAAGRLDGVVRTGRVAYGEGAVTASTGEQSVSVTLRGVDPGIVPALLRPRTAAGTGSSAEASHEASAATQLAPDLRPGADGVAAVLLGKELQRRLALEEGDPVRLVILGRDGAGRIRFRYRSARLAGVFTTGFAEFDARWVLLDRQVLESARGDSGIDVFEVKLAPGVESIEVASRLEELLGPQWLIQRWESLNQELFAALALQEVLLFLVLGLIVVVSTFNVASTLIILVRERHADIGVLSALGLPPRQLWWIFVVYGLGVGGLGIALGVVIGGGAAWAMTEFELIRFDPEVAAIYFIDSVPFRVEASDIFAVVAFSLVVTFIACSLPAVRAARLDPAEALREE